MANNVWCSSAHRQLLHTDFRFNGGNVCYTAARIRINPVLHLSLNP